MLIAPIVSASQCYSNSIVLKDIGWHYNISVEQEILAEDVRFYNGSIELSWLEAITEQWFPSYFQYECELGFCNLGIRFGNDDTFRVGTEYQVYSNQNVLYIIFDNSTTNCRMKPKIKAPKSRWKPKIKAPIGTTRFKPKFNIGGMPYLI